MKGKRKKDRDKNTGKTMGGKKGKNVRKIRMKK